MVNIRDYRIVYIKHYLYLLVWTFIPRSTPRMHYQTFISITMSTQTNNPPPPSKKILIFNIPLLGLNSWTEIFRHIWWGGNQVRFLVLHRTRQHSWRGGATLKHAGGGICMDWWQLQASQTWPVRRVLWQIYLTIYLCISSNGLVHRSHCILYNIIIIFQIGQWGL